jgi:methionine-rich copper-binding protein CopC
MIKRIIPAVLAMTGFAASAMAHAFLQHASPGAGAVLAVAPKEIVLEFSESLQPTVSGIDVTDTAGRDVDAAPLAAISGTVMRVELRAVPPGRYHVHWYAVSVDAHRTEGTYDITIKP